MLLPSPNWYSARIADTSLNGLLVYGSRNNVVVIRLQPREYLGSFCGHEDKISAVVITRSSDTVVSSSVDGQLLAWSLETMKVLTGNNVHAEKSSAKEITGVSVNPSSGRVVSADRAGLVACWDRGTGRTVTYQPAAKPISQLAHCNATCVALGYLTGHISLLDERRGDIIGSLVGHVDEIQCLVAFCPPNEEASFLLSSSRNDKTLKLWDCTTGTLKTSFTLPRVQDNGPAKNKTRKYSLHSPCSRFVTCAWRATGETFLSSNVNGDILEWNVASQKFTKLQSNHNRPVFTISPVPNTSQFVTTSMDRFVVLYDTAQAKCMWRYQALAGFVYALSVQAPDPRKLAIAVGDGTLRVWNLGSKKDRADTLVLWKGLQGKITAIAWHPVDPALIGYGTDDGVVGVYDVYQQKPRRHHATHTGQVYKVRWAGGPDALRLHSVGKEGKLVARADSNDADKVDVLASVPGLDPGFKVSEFAWSRDGSHLAVASVAGAVLVFTADLRQVWATHDHRQMVRSIEWGQHDETALWFATASSDTSVRVYRPEGNAWASTVLRGHDNEVNAVAWSPHDAALLASASSDCTVQVWQASTGLPMHNVRTDSGRVFALAWSWLDSEQIYFGGDDQTVRVARWRAAAHVVPPTASKDRLRKAREEKKQRGPATKEKEKETPVPEAKAPDPPKKRERAYFSTLEQQSRADATALAERQLAGEAFPLPSAEAELEQARGDSVRLLGLALQTNTLPSVLEHTARLGQLTGTLVAASASCGPACWRATTLAFARQLVSQGKFHKAASSYLVLGLSEEAVRVLADGGFFLDALSLAADSHLPESSLDSLYLAWARTLELKPKYELSAACFIRGREPAQAVRVLKHRADSQAVLLASKVAARFKLEDPASLVLLAASHAVGEGNIPAAEAALAQLSQPQAGRAALALEQALTAGPRSLAGLEASISEALAPAAHQLLDDLAAAPSMLADFLNSVLLPWLASGVPAALPEEWGQRRMNDFSAQV
jgi:gem associated protein 5